METQLFGVIINIDERSVIVSLSGVETQLFGVIINIYRSSVIVSLSGVEIIFFTVHLFTILNQYLLFKTNVYYSQSMFAISGPIFTALPYYDGLAFAQSVQ